MGIKHIQFALNEDLHARFKAACAINKVGMTEFLIDAIHESFKKELRKVEVFDPAANLFIMLYEKKIINVSSGEEKKLMEVMLSDRGIKPNKALADFLMDDQPAELHFLPST